MAAAEGAAHPSFLAASGTVGYATGLQSAERISNNNQQLELGVC